MLRRLVLAAALLAGAAGPAAAAPVAAEIPGWRAVLLAAPERAHDDNPVARVRISHGGRVVVDRPLPSATAWFTPGTIRFSNVAGPGHVLVWADVVTSGRDTTTTTVLYDFPAGVAKPRVTSFGWSVFGYEERKIGGKTAYITADGDYYALFDARVFSVTPILVREYRSGTFVDVTPAYPDLVAAEAARYRAAFEPGVCESDEAAGAYLSDMVRVGRADAGVADVTAILRPQSDVSFFKTMNAVLHAKKLLPPERQLRIADGVARCDPQKKSTHA